jgi:DNA ligase-1
MSLFSDLTNLGEQLAATKKKLEHRALIGAYLKTLPPDEIALAARLIIGRVFSESDPRTLNLSGSAIARVLEQLAGASVDWDAIGGAVDFGDAVEKWLTLRKHAPQGKPLQLLQVYHTYEAIAEDTGPGSRERKDELLRGLLARATPREAKYVVKHLVKEMRVGVSEGTLLDAIADASGVPGATIRRANQVSGDVGEVARVALVEGARGLGRMAVRVGAPLKPMLAQSAEDVADAFAKVEGKFALEYKFDGARVQIHKRGDAVRLFSRQLSDMTASLPEIADAARREIRAHKAILEGEVIALTSAGKPRPFQDVMRRFGREREIEQTQRDIPLKLYLFDALYIDGVSLLDAPNAERWEKLQAVRGALECAERIVPRDVAEGEAFLRRARAAGHEGLMAKNLASPYAPGERGKHWLKIKPVITLDLVIVAADWGYGRRTGWLSNVHLAARDAESEKLLEVGKTFKGLTDAEFKTLTERLLADRTSEKRGTVWVKPNVVVEVAFNNVQRSPRYPGGVALRLARIVGFRPDKSVDEIETIQRLRELM